MNTIEKITTTLQQEYPHIKHISESCTVETLPSTENGFKVIFEDGAPEYAVYFGSSGWHVHFWGNVEEALYWFALGLSNKCRLKVYTRGKKDYAWIVERKVNELWIESSKIMDIVFVPFWKKKHIRYLQNDLIQDPKLFVQTIDISLLPRSQTYEEYQQSPVSRRRFVNSFLFGGILLGGTLIAQSFSRTGWLQILFLLLGIAVFLKSLIHWLKYGKRNIK